MNEPTICYQCGRAPCLYAAYLARGDIDTCLMSPRPETVGMWAWNVLYDAALALGDRELTAAAMDGLRARLPSS